MTRGQIAYLADSNSIFSIYIHYASDSNLSEVLPEYFNSDLLISNDAFSELSREIQDLYLKNVVLNAKRGYITWNSWSSTYLGGYSLAELVRVIPNSQIIPEKPLTGKENAIIVWGN